ncbi:MAG: ATP-binding protein [Ignavibacteriaceae bacterium]
MLKKINIQSYYKTRIIVTFSIVTILIVIILSRTGYIFIKNIYLNQLGEQVKIVANMLANQIETDYLDLLEIGNPTGTTEFYFNEIFQKNIEPGLHSEIFIFDKDFEIIVHSDTRFSSDKSEPRLLLNKKEITELKNNSGISSLPFKGDDNNWYLWGFYRLSDNYWIAVRESASRFKEVDELSTLFWLLGLGGVIITIIAGWLMANSITKPLDNLISFSRQIGKGNFLASPPQKMHGEIKLLSDAMDKMKNNLAENQAEKDNMLAQIAHEIRNPLGGILLLVNLIKENPEDYKKNDEYLERILKEINGLKSLITSYLNFSRPVSASPAWVDLNKIVEEIENIFKISIKEKNILLVKNIELEKIYFDEGHLKQIIINLMANSLDCVPDNGTIILTANEKPEWEITFNDDGPGISDTDFYKIFDPFYTTKKNGTGLGLAISRKLCLENNAQLTVTKNGKGATFVITKEPVYES